MNHTTVAINDALQLLALIRDIPQEVATKHQDTINLLFTQAEEHVYKARVPDHPIFTGTTVPQPSVSATPLLAEFDRFCDIISHVQEIIAPIPDRLIDLNCVGINYTTHIQPLVVADYVLHQVVDDLEQSLRGRIFSIDGGAACKN